MNSRWRKVRRWLVMSMPAIGLAGLVLAVSIPFVIARVDASRAAEAAKINRPDIIVEDLSLAHFVDAKHLKLPDGRTFRLAHVIAPDPGTPEHVEAMEALGHQIKYPYGAVLYGLKSVGTAPDGQTLVELWGLQPGMSWCGNSTWSERRAIAIPRWRPRMHYLLWSGAYVLDPAVTDPVWTRSQDSARREGHGRWARPEFLRQMLDLDQLLHAAEQSESDGRPDVRDQRLEAADLLLRADEAKYAPVLLAIVKNANEADVFARIRIAQCLEKAGIGDGTAYFMHALQHGGAEAGLDRYSLNSVANEYWSFWRVQGAPWRSHAVVLKHYQSMKVIPPRADEVDSPARSNAANDPL